MKLFRALTLAALLCMAPMFAFAGDPDDFDDLEIEVIDDFEGDFSVVVPEPTGALLMGAGMVTLAWSLRRRR